MKNKYVACLLALLAGGLGFHKFYLGKIGQGILYILFCWTLIPSIISIFESIIYLCSTQKEFDINYNAEYLKNKQFIENN